MAIAPTDPKPVRAYQLQRFGANVGSDDCGIQQGSPSHLFHTACAGTCQPKLAGGVKPGMPSLIPLDAYAVGKSADGIGDRRKRHEVVSANYILGVTNLPLPLLR